MLSTQFDGFSELNFEDYSVRDIFGQRLDFPDILERVLLMGNGEAQEGRTLTFFDEI